MSHNKSQDYTRNVTQKMALLYHLKFEIMGQFPFMQIICDSAKTQTTDSIFTSNSFCAKNLFFLLVRDSFVLQPKDFYPCYKCCKISAIFFWVYFHYLLLSSTDLRMDKSFIDVQLHSFIVHLCAYLLHLKKYYTMQSYQFGP